MKAIQIRKDFRLTSYSNIIINRLVNKGLFKLMGGDKEKYMAEDAIKDFLQQVLEQGVDDYDVVSLAVQELDKGTAHIGKDVDNVWRMKVRVKLGDNEDSLSISKEDVVKLAVEAYRKEAMRALDKY